MIIIVFLQQPTRKWEPQSYNQKGLSFANYLNELESKFFLKNLRQNEIPGHRKAIIKLLNVNEMVTHQRFSEKEQHDLSHVDEGTL